MPQMMPINWMMLFIFFVFIFILFIILNYYIFDNNFEYKNMKKIYINNFYWKW